ncbi:hypothetical protein L1887_59507 [Cichorium endivia]|nr:hypothetical protein L1887_59507 [Cichorium endivia]
MSTSSTGSGNDVGPHCGLRREVWLRLRPPFAPAPVPLERLRVPSLLRVPSSTAEKKGFERRQAGGEDTQAELEHIPDLEVVFELLVGRGGDFGLQASFEDAGDARNEAEREDDDQGGFGAAIDLESEDDGDGEEREEAVGEDVDYGVEEADETVCLVREAAGAWVHTDGEVPIC